MILPVPFTLKRKRKKKPLEERVNLQGLAKTWKQHKCLLADKWIKMWYTYTVEYYSAIK